MISLIGLGLASDLMSQALNDAIAIVGGIVLIGMGMMYLVRLQRISFQLNQAAQGPSMKTPLAMFGLGVVTTVTNPFWFTWWLTVAAGFLSQTETTSLLGVSAFYLGHISADFAWDTFLSLSASYGKRWLSERLYRWLIFLTACFMMYLGGVFLLNGIH
jgi:threonine/homoserine/homoserine lactone efflux protein